MKSYRLRPSLSYIWFIVIPPTLIIILGVFLNNYWTYGCSGFAFLLFHSLHSSYSIQCTRIHQHIDNHKSADLNSAPFVLLLRSFSSRSGYSIEESGQVMLPGTTQPVEQYVVNSYIGNLDKALGKNGLTLVVIASQNLSLPKSHKVLIVECPDDQWQKNFRTLAKYAKAILIIPEKTTSIVDEIEFVKRQSLWARTIFLGELKKLIFNGQSDATNDGNS